LLRDGEKLRSRLFKEVAKRELISNMLKINLQQEKELNLLFD